MCSLLTTFLHSGVFHHFAVRHLVHTCLGFSLFLNRRFFLLVLHLGCLALVNFFHFYSLKVIEIPSKALPASLESLTAASISLLFVERGSIPCRVAS